LLFIPYFGGASGIIPDLNVSIFRYTRIAVIMVITVTEIPGTAPRNNSQKVELIRLEI
jgi:hypothetical protein